MTAHAISAESDLAADVELVDAYLFSLQSRILSAFDGLEAHARFRGAMSETRGARTSPMVLEGGDTFDKAAVMCTRARGDALPKSVSVRRPEIAGAPFEAVSLSLITHPRNPFVPTVHMNLRFFLVHSDSPLWHFGGGFDLTPVYPFAADALFWHRQAKRAVDAVYPGAYGDLKTACDNYFMLTHRGHARGVGGVFFDDWTRGGFATSLRLIKSLGEHFLKAYLPLVEMRRTTPWNEQHKRFQRLRRGRYAEFNLALDRGTRYGLESGRRTESVLASLPPQADWAYDWHPDENSHEALLESSFLTPRDWLA